MLPSSGTHGRLLMAFRTVYGLVWCVIVCLHMGYNAEIVLSWEQAESLAVGVLSDCIRRTLRNKSQYQWIAILCQYFDEIPLMPVGVLFFPT